MPIHGIVIYPMDSVTYLLSNRGQKSIFYTLKYQGSISSCTVCVSKEKEQFGYWTANRPPGWGYGEGLFTGRSVTREKTITNLQQCKKFH